MTVFTSSLTHKQANQAVMEYGVWLIAYRQINERAFIDNAFIVTKGIKACKAVIASHPAFTYSTKRQAIACQMNDGIIDTATAKLTRCHNLSCHIAILCKNIKGQWMCTSIDIIYNHI